MNHCGITATKNRHSCLERAVTCFLKQDYEGFSTLLIYNNAESNLTLDVKIPENRSIILINRSTTEGRPYANLGEIYSDAIKFVPEDTQVISFMDDDDVFLSNYISSGIKGFEKAKKQGKLAYKPKRSYYRDSIGVNLVENVLEPSIFVDFAHVVKHGFKQTNVDSHYQWLFPLVESDKIFVDPTGIPAFIYDWSGQIPTFKTSGDPDNPKNFQNYNNWSKDNGDGVITSIPDELYKKYTTI